MSRPDQLHALVRAGDRLAAYVEGLIDGLEQHGEHPLLVSQGRDDLDRWRLAASLAKETLRAETATTPHEEKTACTA